MLRRKSKVVCLEVGHMTKYEGIVAAQKQALSVRFNTGETSLASWAVLFLTCGSKRTFSVVLLSPPRKLGYRATADNERQLSCWNKSAHSSVSCHFGGFYAGTWSFAISRCFVAKLDVNFPLPSTTSRNKLTFPFRSRINIADADMLGGEEEKIQAKKPGRGKKIISGSTEEYGSFEWINTGSHHPPSSPLLHCPQPSR